MRRLQRLTLSLLLGIILPLAGISLVQAESPALIFSEIKIRKDTAGFDEYIELYNPGTEPVSLNDYMLGYINTPNPTTDQVFTQAVIAPGLLPGGHSIVLAKNELDPNLPNSLKSPFSSLTDTGGTLRITTSDGQVIDQFAWTSTQSQAVAPIQYLCVSATVACNLNRMQSFTRGKDTDQKYLLESPTWQLATPTPQSTTLLPLPLPDPEPEPQSSPDPEPAPEPQPSPQPEPQPAPESAPQSAPESTPTDTPTQSVEISPTPSEPAASTAPSQDLAPPRITELLPNPAPPASDSTDEYIELYNPNSQSFDLTGYKLQSGTSYSYSYVFPVSSLAAGEYKAFFVSETGAILSNANGQVRLLDPNGLVVAQTNAYEDADDGEAWALVNGSWQWTTTPTPNAANQLTTPAAKTTAPKTTAPKKTHSKKTVAKTPSAKTAKTNTSKAKVAAAKTSKPNTPAEREAYQEPEAGPQALHPGVLVAIGGATLLYAAYEYHQDVINRVRQFRRYRELRRAARAKT